VTGTERTLQNRVATVRVAFVAAARFLGGQLFVSCLNEIDPLLTRRALAEDPIRSIISRLLFEFYAQDTCAIALGECAIVSALRMQGRPALPSTRLFGMDDLRSLAFAAVSLPPVQRKAPGFFLPSEASQGNRNRCRQIYRIRSGFAEASGTGFRARVRTSDLYGARLQPRR
jgi:hypothetical protein